MIPFCRRRPFPNENSIRVLAAVYYELPVSAGRSHQRGLHNTLHACVYYGAITPDHKITDYGVQLLVEHRTRGKEHAANP